MTASTNLAWAYQPQSAVVQCENQPLPTPGTGQLLVANRGIGINPVDWKFIHANPLNWPQGHIPGVDGAGEVVAVGDGVDSRWLGQRVAYHAALKQAGSFARFSVLNAERVMALPEGIDFALAAALPCPLLTAWQAFEKIPVRPGNAVLVAGLGAVNRWLVQMLVQHGFQVDVLSRSTSAETANAMGIRQVFRQLGDIGQRYFAAFDAIGGDHAATLVPLLKANGHIICIQDRVPAPIDPPFSRTISYHEIALGALHDFGDSEQWQALMQAGETLMAQLVSGSLSVEAPTTFPFERMPEALAHSETSKQKTVVLA
ncbi:zinc-binding dehydrogenase [Marinobacter hydrocarbonoclasticus]|nr:zinc-binding dehydrogenase [Marinobacter nauticus]